MIKCNLIFILYVLFSISAASFHNNLKYSKDEREREIDELDSTDDTASPDDTTTEEEPSDNPVPNKFFCFAEASGLTDNKGYKLSTMSCNLPQPNNVEGLPNFSIRDKETVIKCSTTVVSESKFTVTTPNTIEILADHVTITSNWSNIFNKTELYLGCRLGNKYYTSNEEVTGNDQKCPEPLNTNINFNGKCKHNEDDINKLGTDKEYEFTFNENSDKCKCTSSITINGNTINIITDNLNIGSKTSLPCKRPGEETEIMCSVGGWVTLDNVELSSCTLEDTASINRISSLLIGLIVLIILTII